MKVQKTVQKETIRVAAGTVILTGLMIAVYLLLGSLVWPALAEKQAILAFVLGALIGCVAAVLDFFLLGLSVQSAAEYQAAHPLKEEAKVADEETEETADDDEKADIESKRPYADPETAAVIRAKMKRSYFLRRLLLVAFAALGLLPFINLVAVLLPLLFPKFVVIIVNMKENKKKGGK